MSALKLEATFSYIWQAGQLLPFDLFFQHAPQEQV